jgi:hypothetical protein
LRRWLAIFVVVVVLTNTVWRPFGRPFETLSWRVEQPDRLPLDPGDEIGAIRPCISRQMARDISQAIARVTQPIQQRYVADFGDPRFGCEAGGAAQ